jgi:hypothetical protein
MNTFVITYDLVKQRDYVRLYEALKTFPNWGHVTESVWVVQSPWSVVEVRNYLMKFMDGDDRIFVVQSARSAAWNNVLCPNDWLQSAA